MDVAQDVILRYAQMIFLAPTLMPTPAAHEFFHRD